MKKKPIIICIILILLILNIYPISLSNKIILKNMIYVDDDAASSWYDETHVKTINEGINNASLNDIIYIYNGTYVENIIINKTIDLIGEDEKTTILDGNNLSDVIIINSDFVNISKITVKNGEDNGIFINSSNTKIENTIIKENDVGLYLFYSNNNSVSENQFYDNLNAIHIKYSKNNSIENNSIVSNDYKGIWLESSQTSIIKNNNITENQEGFIISWSFNLSILENVIMNNSEKGIYIISSNNLTLDDNDLKNNKYSIYLDFYTKYCKILRNTITSNDIRGIYIKDSSNNTVLFNRLMNNKEGISVYYSNNNIFKNNNASYNEKGVNIKQSFNNIFEDNSISYNSIGIHIFQNSYNNEISKNLIKLNYNNSIFIEALLDPSNSNIIFNNNFLHNSTIFNVTDECSNIWNNNSDLYYGGNYWSDFDEPSEGAFDNNSDGIVDSPYIIQGGSNKDLYPLMRPYNPWEVRLDFNSNDNCSDYVVFGETPDAIDGQDDRDVPKPGIPPAPYLYAWFEANLSIPYQKIWYDYRHYPDTLKIWDLYLKCNTSDPSKSSTDITISWNINDINKSEYNIVELYEYGNTIPLIYMKTIDNYTFNAIYDIEYHFQIKNIINPINDYKIILYEGWNYITLPFNKSVTSSNFWIRYNEMKYNWSTAVFNGYIGSSIFWWNNSGPWYDSITENIILHPGLGYWFYSYANLELYINYSIIPYWDGNISILKPGWNGLGIPTMDNYKFNNLTISWNSIDYNLSDAILMGLLESSVFWWDNSGPWYQSIYDLNEDLIPAKGYWFYAYDTCIIKLN